MFQQTCPQGAPTEWAGKKQGTSKTVYPLEDSDHSVQLTSSKYLSQITGCDRFWKITILLVVHGKQAAKLGIHTRVLELLPDASTKKLVFFSWISLSFWDNTLLIPQIFCWLCFLPWPRTTDSTSRDFGTEHFGSRGGGLLAAHSMEQAHGQGVGLRGKAAGAGHLTDIPSPATFIFWFLFPHCQVSSWWSSSPDSH